MAFATGNVVTQVAFDKIINGDAGIEFLIKGSYQLRDTVELKFGVSEGFTAPRANIKGMNHAGQRLDIGAQWNPVKDFWVGYNHSIRQWFDGAEPKSVYIYDSVDQIYVRTEFKF